MGTETTPRKPKNGRDPALDRLCLVCPLSDCFQKSKGCLQREENRARGKSLLYDQKQREKRFGYQ